VFACKVELYSVQLCYLCTRINLLLLEPQYILILIIICRGQGKYIQHRMYRESCLAVEGNFLKDLTVLGRDLTQSVLVDNSPHAFGYQVDNGIPIESWFEDPKDTELLKLERFLRNLHGQTDVRQVVRKKFQTYRLVEEA
jgi:CTD small phosphatase-like protein 2